MIVHQNKAERLLQALQTEIESLPEGARLRSVRQIMTHYQVSQSTAVQALDKLERSGWILRRPGKGIFRYGSGNKQERRIALLTPDWPSAAYIELENSLRSQSSTYHCSIWRFSFPFDSEDIFRYLPMREFDVVLVIKDTMLSLNDVDRINHCPIPVLFIGCSYYELALNCVWVDPIKNGMAAAAHLIQKGHRRLAALITEPHNSIIRRRVDGYCLLAKSHNIDVHILDVNVHNGENSTIRSYDFLNDYLDHNKPDFTALYLLSDPSAQAVYNTFITHGFRLPEDISLIGADGLSDGKYLQPAFTTIGLEFNAYGKHILDAVDQLIQDKTNIVQMELAPNIINRDSVRDLTEERKRK